VHEQTKDVVIIDTGNWDYYASQRMDTMTIVQWTSLT